MDQTKESQPQQITALQLWNGIIREKLSEILFTKPHKQSLVIPIRLAMDRTEKAIRAAEQFEVTKHRVQVDTIISKLEVFRKDIEDKEIDFKRLRFWRIRKRRELGGQILQLQNMKAGLQIGLHIVVNTPPNFNKS